MDQNLLEVLRDEPLEKLAEGLEVLADRLTEHRRTHAGFVPLPIFPFCIGIGGIYPCVEIVVRVKNFFGFTVGYALKKRTTKEQGWVGKYQIAGTAGRQTDNPERIFQHLWNEIYGTNAPAISKKAKFIGVEIHDEIEERQAVCWTLVYQTDIKKSQLAYLSEGWKLFRQHELDGRVVDHHRHTLAWVASGKRQLFADLR
jgi:hypothetical protein